MIIHSPKMVMLIELELLEQFVHMFIRHVDLNKTRTYLGKRRCAYYKF